LIRELDLSPGEIVSIEVYVTPPTYRLVGKKFEIGDNPKVDGQFNIQYCIANALLRKNSKLEHFDEASIKDPQVYNITKMIHVFSDAALDARGLTAVRMQVRTREGILYNRSIDVAPGFPGNPLSKEDHINRFRGCIEYAGKYFNLEKMSKIISLVEKLEEIEDVRSIIPWLKNSRLQV
jgi:2-methylcitrate dehydratase PrpD